MLGAILIGTVQANVRREASPSPSLRERQRYARTQSMPIVASLNDLTDDVHATQEQQAQGQSQSSGLVPTLGYPRPIVRVAPPQFLAHTTTDKWQMVTDQQENLEQLPPPVPGTEGVAYAGGAGSINVPYGRGMKAVAAEAAEGARRRASETQAAHRGSPLAYALRKPGNTSPGFQSMPSPRSLKNRTPDRSLPVQEEPDDHDQAPRARASPALSSDLNSTKDLDHDIEGTLVDLGDDGRREVPGESTDGSGSHTPRSPSAMVFEQEQAQRGIHEVLQPDKTPIMKPAQTNKNFSATDFQHTLKKLQHSPTRNGNINGNINGSSTYPPPTSSTPGYPPPTQPFSRNESRGSYPNWIPDFYHNYPDVEDFLDEAAYMQQFMQPAPFSTAQNGNARPTAPIPPTPHSQTSAPTPFQVNGQNGNEPNGRNVAPPYSPAPGTPYPYPFSHMRRGFVYPPVSRMPSTVYDPSVAQVQEQIRLQMQMYAYNNGAMTDSTLSPSSTPYPGMGPSYTPFGAFLNQTRAFARARAEAAADGRVTSAASFRSSPSHQPVSLPPLDGYAGRGRMPGLQKRDRFTATKVTNNAMRTRAQRVKPPPRVDSTQPRDTSPESSSGEETAGEKYEVNITAGHESSVAESQEWTNASVHVDEDNGEWVDEDSGDEQDLLDLEFHPSYVSNPERRRKKWQQRWEELVRSVSLTS